MEFKVDPTSTSLVPQPSIAQQRQLLSELHQTPRRSSLQQQQQHSRSSESSATASHYSHPSSTHAAGQSLLRPAPQGRASAAYRQFHVAAAQSVHLTDNAALSADDSVVEKLKNNNNNNNNDMDANQNVQKARNRRKRSMPVRGEGFGRSDEGRQCAKLAH